MMAQSKVYGSQRLQVEEVNRMTVENPSTVFIFYRCTFEKSDEQILSHQDNLVLIDCTHLLSSGQLVDLLDIKRRTQSKDCSPNPHELIEHLLTCAIRIERRDSLDFVCPECGDTGQVKGDLAYELVNHLLTCGTCESAGRETLLEVDTPDQVKFVCPECGDTGEVSGYEANRLFAHKLVCSRCMEKGKKSVLCVSDIQKTEETPINFVCPECGDSGTVSPEQLSIFTKGELLCRECAADRGVDVNVIPYTGEPPTKCGFFFCPECGDTGQAKGVDLTELLAGKLPCPVCSEEISDDVFLKVRRHPPKE